MSNKTFKVFVDKMGGTTATNYIGNDGELFYDPATTTLRIGDGTTPGGTVVSGGGSGVTGNIDIASTGSQINFVANSSGDGAGASTIELIPDTNVTWGDQCIVIDPTAPSHIHIRAGGTQDQSQAQLYLGGEKNHVRITDSTGVRLQNEYTFDDYFFYDESEFGFASGTWFTQSGSHYVQFTTNNINMQSNVGNFGNSPLDELGVTYGETTTLLTPSGYYGNLGSNTYMIGVNEAPPSSPTALTAINFHLFFTNVNDVVLENNDFNVDVADDIRMYARDRFALHNYSTSEGIELHTDYDNQDYRFTFTVDGGLEFPQGGTLRFDSVVPSSSIGTASDKAGTLAFNNTHIYFCTANYDGANNVWKRIAWSNDTW